MVLRSSISNTRKLFQKTIDNFKSFFFNNGTYHKLPKTPNNTSTNINNDHPNSNIITSSSSSIHKQFQPKPKDYVTTNKASSLQPRIGDRDETLFSQPKVNLVRTKLKEMEKMMNDDIISDEYYVSDVREFLHCYSRLRYTAYLDVVENFFMEVYSDFFSPHHLVGTRKAAVQRRHPAVVGIGSYGGHKH
ncbi:hypothetical protein AtNW77_Chr3g0184301 [Arabidopsis thaliana]|uniref:Uncharacterized protein n=2 Tax=Arabidopsis TaxID=3701 RepID=A0A178VBI1_ARATH|nr:hypothetical protein ISN45_At03g026050 [Arabidopsis thaliana x Arabidopsis arenosa]OAP03549.1 hypothetical protein AXX17_AT3G26550 [Arabidopsis thaliana]